MKNNVNCSNANNIRVACFSFVILLSACWLYSINAWFLLDPDTYWHIAVGKEIWETGHFPVSDSRSHTFLGHPWIAKEWLSQIILYLVHRTGGWTLLISLVVSSLSLAASLLYFFLSARISNTLALIIALASLVLSMQTYLARPHVLTFPLCVLWAEYMLRASEQDRAPSFWLLPIVVLWANLHNSFTIAFVIAALCAANFFERSGVARSSTLYRWLLFLVLCLLASMLHPYGYKPLLVSLDTPGNEWLKVPAGEWRAVDVVSEPIHIKVLFLLLFLLLAFGLKLNFSKTAFVLLMLYSFLSHIRFAYLFYYTVPLAISFEIGAQYPRLSASRWAENLDDKVSVFLSRRAPVIAVCVISLYLVVAAAFIALLDVAPRDDIAPARALAAARAANLTGNVLNSNEFGGFLISAGVKTFLDGRNDQLFRGQFLRDVLKSREADGDAVLSRQLSEYKIGWTLLRPRDPRIQKLDADAEWKRFYQDHAAVIHIRTKPAD